MPTSVRAHRAPYGGPRRFLHVPLPDLWSQQPNRRREFIKVIRGATGYLTCFARNDEVIWQPLDSHRLPAGLLAQFKSDWPPGLLLPDGCAIRRVASINSDTPNPTLLDYATTKCAIRNFTAGPPQLLAEQGIRENAVAPGPIWPPLIPSTMPADAVKNFGKQVPMKRPGQPAELATAYVMLADPLSNYVSGATIAVTSAKPFI